MKEIRHAVERRGAESFLAARPPQPSGGRDQRRASPLRHLFIAILALLVSAGRTTPALAATGAGSLARPVGSKPCTGGILNSQFWKVQAGDTVMARITGAKDAKPTSGTTVPVLIQSDLSLLGNVTVAGTLTGTPGTNSATITFTWPYSMGPSCGTSHIGYWGGSAAGFLPANSALLNGSKSTPAGWAIVDTSCSLVGTNPMTGRCYPPLSGVQCPLQSGLLDCANGSSQFESFSFGPGGIIGGQPPYTVTASATNSVALAPAGGYSNITLSSNGLGFSGTFPAGQSTVTITVTDTVGASVQCTFAVTIDHLTVTVADAAVCSGFSTTLKAQPAGGSGPYSFSWSGPGGFTGTGQTISVSAAGQYTVVTTDSNGCKGQGSGALAVNQPPSASISGQTNVSCYGDSTGSATVTVTGGASPYTVTDGTNTQKGAGPFTFSSLAANTYNYTATDANGCTASTVVTITQPAAALAASISGQTNVSCSGDSNGSAMVTVTGGASPYKITDGTTTQNGSGPFTFTSLSAKSYSYTVTDANNCTAGTSVTITQPAALMASTSQTNVSCSGDSTGSATVTVTGGTSPYTVTDGKTSQTGAGPFTFSNLAANTYNYSVTDSSGCTASASVTITQPAHHLAIAAGLAAPISCYGGTTTVNVDVFVSTPPFTFSDGTTTKMAPGDTSFTEPAGSYTFTVTDANGCTASQTLTIAQPAAPLTASLTAQTNICSSGSTGSATASISGGTAPYSWSWNTSPAQTGTGATATATGLAAGTYTLTVTDKNGCTASTMATIAQPATPLDVGISWQPPCVGASNGVLTAQVFGGTKPYSYSWNTNQVQTGATAAGLAAGSYTVTVTDKNGCTASATKQLDPSHLTVSINGQTNVSCNGGSDGTATATLTGDSPPFNYSWNTSPPQTGVYMSPGVTATGLAAGTYTVTVTDPLGCTATAMVTITEPPAPLTVGITGQTNVSTSGGSNGSATATISGGTAPYFWSWNTTPPQTGAGATATAMGLSAGSYTVTVTDKNGCTATAMVTISLSG